MTLKLLDCFCGIGGVSDGFALEGFDVTGIDIVDAPKMLGYKHRFIQADMQTLKGEDFRGYDVIWGSPPCRDFTIINTNKYGWKRKKNPHRGLVLVHAFLGFVEDAQPRIWILENTFLLKRYLLEKPVLEAKLTRWKKHCFWGNFSPITIPQDLEQGKIRETVGWDKLASWKRAKIPLACSRAFAVACRNALEGEK